MKKALALIFVLALLSVGGAQAITYGQPDGNNHPNVGAMLRLRPSDNMYRIVCSGSLISPTVFLTASHCTSFVQSFDPPYNQAWVTFDSTFTSSTTLPSSAIHGTMYTNPNYNQAQSDPGDIAVIVLDQAVSGVDPVDLPTAGLLDQMKADGTLRGTQFTSVGYGIQEPQPGPGGIVNAFPMERWYAAGTFWALNPSWLRISQNQATGSGGTCSGDSGGPQFLGAGSNETTTQVSITITGDVFCFATNVDYRLDTPSARTFLSGFGVPLP
ncbi:MAG TPA: trypsin-like serine protease [Gaiellaceae bacterium]